MRSRHELPADEVEIAQDGAPVPLRKYLRFAGGGSVADDSGNGRTVVSLSGGPSSGFKGFARYVSSPQSVTPSADFDAGSVFLNEGDISWIHGSSDPSTGLWVFGASGLYTVELRMFLSSTGYVTGDQIGIGADVYFGDQLGTNLNRYYTVERGIRQIAASTWAASFTITDYFDANGVISVYWLHSSVLTSVTGSTETILTKVI
jgi:hypothetical protein